MSKDVDWIAAVIERTREQENGLSAAVWTQLEALLRGKLSERQLPSGELATIAKLLIRDVVPASLTDEDLH